MFTGIIEETGTLCEHCEADAIQGHGAFFYNIAQQMFLCSDRIPDCIFLLADHGNLSCAVNMPGDDMSAEHIILPVE